jgi:hypothetical protein
MAAAKPNPGGDRPECMIPVIMHHGTVLMAVGIDRGQRGAVVAVGAGAESPGAARRQQSNSQRPVLALDFFLIRKCFKINLV